MKSAPVHGWLLDTHAMLWMLYGDSRLSATARKIIEGDLPLAYSTVSFWEIALKQSRQGFDFQIGPNWDAIIPKELERIGVVRWDIEAADCRRTETLPAHHADPFDRLLLAKAFNRRYGILTKDKIFADYTIPTAW